MLASLGNLALARGDAPSASSRYLEALALHQEINNGRGVAGAHGYLARASLISGRHAKAVLVGRALGMLERLGDGFGQMLALQILVPAFAGLDQEEEAEAALILAWCHAAAIGHPLAQQFAQQTGQPAPDPDDVEVATAVLSAALAACEKALAASGEDPYAPLPPRAPS